MLLLVPDRSYCRINLILRQPTMSFSLVVSPGKTVAPAVVQC